VTGELWSWQVLDARSEVQSFGTIPVWGTPDEQRRLAGR